MTKGPYELVRQMVAIFEDLSIPYALGGSVASSMLGEPRSTVDVDFAVVIGEEGQDRFLDRVAVQFYVPTDSARDAIRLHSSFNLLDTANALFSLVNIIADQMISHPKQAAAAFAKIPENKKQAIKKRDV